MLHRKSIIVFTLVLIAAVGIWSVSANALIDQKAVLSGKVTGVVAVGASVCEGDTLASISTITGSLPVARATTDGIVKEVLVHPGDSVRSGDVVARIQSTRR
ncbi:biotin/lipoyl-containing protein [Dendrosporobacter sp. 1207_IL3150]|uniref:biotin/lipoyl-containing protein n=1 Tax=Dendrosporobacter sp. 1207_IL3150 TaxID=3084054 RepID=UPI002FDA645C